jgi:hypothetical protein
VACRMHRAATMHTRSPAAFGRSAAAALVFAAACGGASGSTGESKGEQDAAIAHGADAAAGGSSDAAIAHGADAAAGGFSDAGACPGATLAAGVITCRVQEDCPPGQQCSHDPIMYPPGPSACPGRTQTCTQDSDCTGGLLCATVNYGKDCGGIFKECYAPCRPTSCTPAQCPGTVPCRIDEQCISGKCEPLLCPGAYTCAAGETCAPTRSSADWNGCAPALCTTDGFVCPPGTICASGPFADAHGCEPTPCNAGFTCPPDSRCNPSSVYFYPHDCVKLTCAADSDCDCGVCIQGHCEDRLFVCSW